MDNYFSDKVKSGSKTGRVTKGDKLKAYIDAFISPIDGDDNPLLKLKDDYLCKVFNGIEQLPKDIASYVNSNIDSMIFEDFSDDLTIEARENIILQFAYQYETITIGNFANDITKVLQRVLYYIINIKPSQSIRESIFVSPGIIKIGGRKIYLPPELTPSPDLLDKEMPYVNALLKVYSQAEKFESITLANLKAKHPRYETHFKLQRQNYFSAEGVLRQIRDIFNDGEKEFNLAKDETYIGLTPVLYQSYKNALARVDATLSHVVLISFGKIFLTAPNNNYVGHAEKQGMVHMLVNDKRIEWVVDYDEDI